MFKKIVACLLSTILISSGLNLSPDISTAQTNPQLEVDLSVENGEMLNGGAGFLYGMSEPNVPDINTIIPLKPYATVQKAPDGLQHPNGDALKVSDYFLEAGGQQVQIYLQDIYEHWPYEFTGIPDYLSKIETTVKKVIEHPNKDTVVYVPFNEPDHIWYGGMNTQAQERFFSDWKTVVEKIKSLHPDARIAGPNFAGYNGTVYRNFFKFAKENDVLPDIVTWHELGDDFFSGWESRYNHYRSIEEELGFGPLEININEYARPRDPSNQGVLLQFLAKFERSKVYGALPYWHMADNLNDLVVESNRVNGAWWLYKWTGEMKGKQTVQVTPPDANAMGLEGIATIDKSKKQAQVVFGGMNGSADIVLKGVNSHKEFGDNVHVTVWESAWTGFDGAAGNPVVVHEKDYPVVDGRVVVPVSNMHNMSAYKAIISPATAKSTFAQQPWKKIYEAENALLSGKATEYDLGNSSEYIEWPTSGGKQVGGIDDEDSSVTFNVNVPEDGKYLMDVFYGNGPLGPEQSIANRRKTAKHLLKIDDGETNEIVYPANVGFKFIGIKKVYLDLKAGNHTLSFSGMPVMQDGHLTRVALLDRIDLTRVGMYGKEVVPKADRYEAEYAELNGDASMSSNYDNYNGTGYVSFSGEEKSGVMFVVNVQENGYYETKFKYSTDKANSKVEYFVDRNKEKDIKLNKTESNDEWKIHSEIRYLKAGINLIELKNGRENLNVDYLEVKAASSNTEKQIQTIEAEAKANTVAGAANVHENSYASGDKHVGSIGKGADNYLQFNDITVPKSGKYKLIVHYANNEQKGNHSYNANVVERHAKISINGNPPSKTYFRSTYSWETFRSIVLDVELVKGSNAIRFFNDTETPDFEQYAPDIDKIEIAPVETIEPILSVKGPHTVKVTDSFNLTYSLDNAPENIHSLKMSLQFDSDIMEFVSVDSLNEKIKIKAEESIQPGVVELNIEGMPGQIKQDNDLFKINLKAKESEKLRANITLSNVLLGNKNKETFSLDDIGHSIDLLNDVSEIILTGLEGATSITTNRGTLQMKAQVLPANAKQGIKWSVVNLDGLQTDLASISSDGLLSANHEGKNGQVRVIAEATDGSGIVSEAEIDIKNQLIRVTGTPFGKNPPWAPGGEYDKAFDGNVNTFYDFSQANGGFTGIDFGVNTQEVINEIRYYPRSGYTGRMVGGKIQGSNTSPTEGFVDIYTITSTPELGWNVAEIDNEPAYRYIRYLSPEGGYGNVAELEFYR
jgi:hypothetical protein